MSKHPDDPAESGRGATLPGAAPLSLARIDGGADAFARAMSRRHHVPGDVLAARYRIIRELGDGGMGDVFVAQDLSIGRQVAIKVLKPELLANEALRKRFQKEAEAVAAVGHPNVVRFLDMVVGDPTFLVMEYIEGPTLSLVLKGEKHLAPLRAAELARRLCWGLDATHRAGVIHRDVKPSNIILAPDAEFGEQPKLIDFGVAKTLAHPKEAQLTRYGQIVGTPHFMCPEQISGAEVDARSDVYSLGCVLYLMIAGRPPFTGEEYEVLRQHVERASEPVSFFAPEVPPELERVLKRALAKDPASRFRSMQEMAHALAEVTKLKGPSNDFTEGPTTTELLRPVRRRGGSLGPKLAVVSLLAAALGAGAAWQLRGRAASLAGGLLIASDPTGATVEVDGRPIRETTPAAIQGLAAGEHLVRLRHQARADVERHVALRAGERQLVEIVMPQSNHRVDVTTAPAAARVYLDGNVVLGTTPTSINVTDDDFHELRIERDGYEPLTLALKPEDRQPELSFTLDPEKEPRGTLTVDSNGAVQVWLDGVYTGFNTPTLGFRVTAGLHVVELHDSSGLRSAPTKFTMHKGEAVHLTLGLISKAAP